MRAILAIPTIRRPADPAGTKGLWVDCDVVRPAACATVVRVFLDRDILTDCLRYLDHLDQAVDS